MTEATITRDRAVRLSELSREGVLVLPNAWDAGSAAVMADAGARAIATTSAGVAWSLGYGDGERVGRDLMIEAVGRVAAAVNVPVTADVEAGYGREPDEVAETVRRVIAAGAVGVNLEDGYGPGLLPPDEHAARVRAARTAATESEVPEFLINARTDVFLRRIGEPAGQLDDVLARAAAYAEAGADSIFVPGLLDLAALRKLTAASPLPVNAMAVPGGPAVAELTEAGVRRISLGPAITEAAYSLAHRATRLLLEKGTYDALSGSLGFAGLEGLFRQ